MTAAQPRRTLIADERERAIIPTLREVIAESEADIARLPVTPYLRVATLATSDYVITQHDNTTPAILIERKSLTDYAASIRDGRHENKQRMIDLRAQIGCQVYYIVEGGMPCVSQHYARIPGSTLISSIMNLMVRDHIFVIVSRNRVDTCKQLLALVASTTRHYPGPMRPIPVAAPAPVVEQPIAPVGPAIEPPAAPAVEPPEVVPVDQPDVVGAAEVAAEVAAEAVVVPVPPVVIAAPDAPALPDYLTKRVAPTALQMKRKALLTIPYITESSYSYITRDDTLSAADIILKRDIGVGSATVRVQAAIAHFDATRLNKFLETINGVSHKIAVALTTHATVAQLETNEAPIIAGFGQALRAKIASVLTCKK